MSVVLTHLIRSPSYSVVLDALVGAVILLVMIEVVVVRLVVVVEDGLVVVVGLVTVVGLVVLVHSQDV